PFGPGAYRRVLAGSARVRDEVAADYGVPRELIRVLYNGVDLERFHPARRAALGRAARRALGLADGERLCAAIGSGFARKGFDLLLRLWREAPPSCSSARSPPWSWTTRRIWSRSRARWLTPSAPSTTPSREPPARAPRTSPGTGTSMASKHCWRRSPVADSAQAAPARRDPATAEPRYLRRGRLRARVAPA